MGLENKQSEKTQYVSIVDSQFTVRCKEGDEGAIERTNKRGEKVWEKHYNSLTAHIQHIEKHVTEWEGKKIISWDVRMQEVLEEFILKLPYNGREAKSLLVRLPGIDFDNEVTFNIGKVHDDKKGKDIPYMTVWQHGKKVEPAFTKDTPEYPKMKQIKVKGVDVWDDTEQMEFLETLVEKYFPKKVVKKDVEETTTEGDGDSDLPF